MHAPLPSIVILQHVMFQSKRCSSEIIMEMTRTTGRSPSSDDLTVVSRDVASDCGAATLRRHRHWPAPEPIRRGASWLRPAKHDISTPSSGKKTDLRPSQGNRLTSLYPIQEKLITGPPIPKKTDLFLSRKEDQLPPPPIPDKGYIVTVPPHP